MKIQKLFSKKLILTLIIIASNSLFIAPLYADEILGPVSDVAVEEAEINPSDYIYKKYDDDYKLKLEDNNLEYSEIDDLVHNYNSNVLTMWNKYENNKSAQEIYNDYMDAYDALVSAASSQENDAAAARLSAQAYSMKLMADNNVNDSIIEFYNHYDTEKKLVLTSKLNFLNYYVSRYNLSIAKENYNKAVNNLEDNRLKFQAGINTEIDYLQAEIDKNEKEASVSLSKSNVETDAKAFKVSVGKSVDPNVLIGDMIPFDINVVSQINLMQDIDLAITNNYIRKSYIRALKNAVSDEMKNNYQILVDYADESIKNDVTSKYTDLTNELITYQNKILSERLSQETLNNANKDLANDNISKSEYQNFVTNKTIASYEVQKQLINVCIKYETYKAAVMGIATASFK